MIRQHVTALSSVIALLAMAPAQATAQAIGQAVDMRDHADRPARRLQRLEGGDRRLERLAVERSRG